MAVTLPRRRSRTGWSALLSKAAGAALVFLAVTGLAVTFGPFHAVTQWGLLAHTAIGAASFLLLVWYIFVHWLDYRRYQLSSVLLLGYVALAGLAVCLFSGIVVTWQGVSTCLPRGAGRISSPPSLRRVPDSRMW